MPHDLIVFGEDWGGLPSSTQHLIQHLAQDRQVLWINSIGLRRPALTFHDLQRAWVKLFASRESGQQTQSGIPVPDKMQIINLKTIPAPRSQWERKLAAWLMRRQLLPILRQSKLRDPILWTSLPTAADLCGQLSESAVVYYCGDDFSALAGVDHQTISQHEQTLVHRADFIMVASPVLAEQFPASKTRILPHGVDFSRFNSPVPRAADLPDDGRPVAGFYGSLSEWLDYPLLAEVIKRLPDWHFVFIGQTHTDISPIAALPQVHLLGPRAHDQLPSYSQHWQVSLLPFVDNAQIRACNPLKLLEYLAVGQPVVATPFPALTPFRKLIHVARNADEMVHAIQRAYQQSPVPHQANVVADHTWQQRAAQVSQWLEVL
ncbi:glycosyltransferase [Photobacterium galatheae]|uniref:Glycosyl transferase n=1 Tax=Photobacterium galatheae TaxID=1654360 RepID=A0A066RSR0_9GAMM|nr:glycosyltransferase [Photobacterium galatheae]KDM93394.1 glycosyl transferase [Photobacterium galatheae]MCM0146973.1 glycosyltransferase [Photobacterium galatheae]